jgi:hypothetical protein
MSFTGQRKNSVQVISNDLNTVFPCYSPPMSFTADLDVGKETFYFVGKGREEWKEKQKKA